VELAALRKQAADRPRPTPLSFRPLATSAAVLTKLRRVSSFSRTSGELDVPRVVDHLSRGRFPAVLRRRTRKTWGQSIDVVLDHHQHLTPYRQDQDAVVQILRRAYPRDGVRVADLRDGATRPHRRGTPRSATYQPPEPGTNVLALSDLGALAVDRFDPFDTWLALGRLYRETGARPIALVPCDLGCIPPETMRDWIVIPWESHVASRRAGLSSDQVDRVARRILTLLSYALRLEPILIREVRRMLVKGRLGAGIEARVWQDAALKGRHFEAAELYPDAARELQHNFERELPDCRREVIDLLQRCHSKELPAVWFLERLALEAESARLGLPSNDLAEAISWVLEQRDELRRDAARQDPMSDESIWFRRAFDRLPESPLHGSASDELHEIWALTSTADDRPPVGLDPTRIPALEEPIRTFALRQIGDHLVARPFDDAGASTRAIGSPLGLIRTRNRQIKVEPGPSWAVDWGRDHVGDWASFEVGGVRQKLRWIPPGEFLMGSPENEEGRFNNEGPQHEVTVKQGFWLFETPCTQELWEAVMGENPSNFRGATRPVEKVSWDACQQFVSRMAELVSGLQLSLPSEEQWEYACRAGTTTARYGEQLSEIAWYLKNSGSQTHPVGQKLPNLWGLHDMLGNVYEWCEDPYGPYPGREGAASADRVLRGGSWRDDARYVRAAYRLRYFPGYRISLIGFRCAESRSSGPVGRVEPASESGREKRWLNLAGREEDRVAFPAVVPIRILFDLDELTIRTLTRPAWAADIGRDRHGLWADLRIGDRVTQRLRWIPPGWFLMGSPEGEAGRYGDEGPQYEVTMERGFWMFETPCTQALWEAVMKNNPSRFRSLTRPVEQVSWDDCQQFITRLNAELKGLKLSLPSEAQWEYACRAGTTTATYAGDLEILGDNNAPLLDDIAWYGGNCGMGFDLPEGYDMSGWREKQYTFERGGTRPVGSKQPNGWGLYDMLGNVWEWCADTYRPYDGGETDRAASADRVLRGGSWGNDAGNVRSAVRIRFDPGHRDGIIGLRCAEFRGQEPEMGGRAVSEPERVAEPREVREPARREGWLKRFFGRGRK
jgi:formylglycine-generating enzyme required for sulfatase activity